jgi:O-Antigen ligase
VSIVYEQSAKKPNEKHRSWIVPLILFSLLSQGLAVSISGRTPHVLIFDIALMGILGWLGFELCVGKLKLQRSDVWITRLFIAFFLGQVVSLLLNERDVMRGAYAIKVSVFAVFSYLVICVLIKSRSDLQRATYGLVVWGAVVGLLLTISFVAGWSADLGPEASYEVKDEVGIGLGRSNYVAAILVLILPIGMSTIFSHRGLQRILLAVSSGLMSLGLLITMSKGAFLSLAVGLICSVPLMRRQGIRLRHAVIFLIITFSFFLLIPRDLVLSNLNMFVYRLATPDLDRVDLWNVAWQTFTRNPLVGVGPGAIYLYNQQFAIAVADTHNFVLQQLAELGIIGAMPFFLILGTFLRRSYRLCTRLASDDPLRFLPVGLFAGMLSTLVHGLVEPTFPGQQYAVVFWLCMGLMFVLYRQQNDLAVLSARMPPRTSVELAGARLSLERGVIGG